MPALHLELLATALVVGDEEFFDLIQKRLVDVVQRLDVLVIIRVNSDGQQPVVLRGLSLFCLPGLDNPDDTNIQQTTDMRRLVHEYHYVEGIAIVGQR